jgi:hypothetical protein
MKVKFMFEPLMKEHRSEVLNKSDALRGYALVLLEHIGTFPSAAPDIKALWFMNKRDNEYNDSIYS